MEKWDDLRLFLAVARAGTLTEAADALDISVSTLHRRLGSLETDIGTRLFDKGPRGYRLTHAGEALLPEAEAVEEAVFSARRTVVGHDQQASGDVRLTLPLMLLSVVAPHLAEFSRMCRRIRLIIQPDDGRLSLERETDLALRATSTPDLTAVGRELCGVAWGRYAPGGLQAPETLPWIHYVGIDASPPVRWRIAAGHTDAPAMQVHGIMGMVSVLPHAGAQGLLPCFVGDPHPGLTRLGPPVATDRLWLLVHADLRRSARVRALIDFLVPRLVAERDRFEVAASLASSPRQVTDAND